MRRNQTHCKNIKTLQQNRQRGYLLGRFSVRTADEWRTTPNNSVEAAFIIGFNRHPHSQHGPKPELKLKNTIITVSDSTNITPT